MPNRAYQLGLAEASATQLDQRMQEDCRLLSEFSTELGVGMLQAFMMLASFIGVLWTLSSYASFDFRGEEVVVPGYMVWVAIGYAGIGSGLTWVVGRPLIRLNTIRYYRVSAQLADFQVDLVYVSQRLEIIVPR